MSTPRTLTLSGVALALLAGAALPARAQEPGRSFEDLEASGSLLAGSYIRLVDRDGDRVTGRVESLSGNMLSLRVGDEVREVPESSVDRIWRRRPDDPKWNGSLVGLGAGLGTGIAFARGSCSLPDDECLAITTILLVPAFSAGGALIGYFVDRATRGYDSVFEAPAPPLTGSLRVSPVFSRNGKGVRVSFSF
jgi:hypothetical protein